MDQLRNYDPSTLLLTRARLRAALALALSADDVTTLTRDLAELVSSSDLRNVGRSAVSRYSMQRLRNRFRKPGDVDPRPLSPASGMPAATAFVLALHVGGGVGSEALGDVFDRTPAEIGVMLDAGRRAVDPSLPGACREWVGLVGRYRDTAMDAGERIELLTHLRSCERCRLMIERATVVDDGLDTQAHTLALATTPTSRPNISVRSRAASTAGLFLAGALVLGLVVSVAMLAGVATNDRGDAIPLVAADTYAGLSGWVLTGASTGAVTAHNLGSGASRQVSPAQGDDAGWWVSPDTRRVTTYSSAAQIAGPSSLMVHELDGTLVGDYEWLAGDFVREVIGWVDNDTLLMNVRGSVDGDNIDSDGDDATVVAFDVLPGGELVVARGETWSGVLSPDGSTLALAVDHAVEPQLAGAALRMRPVRDGAVGEPDVEMEQPIVPSGGIVWAADSSEVFVMRILDEEPRRPGQLGVGDRGYDEADIVAMSRSGSVRSMPGVPEQEPLAIESVSPSTGELLYSLVKRGTRAQSAYVALERASAERMSVTGIVPTGNDLSWRQDGILWSPDGRTMLTPVAIKSSLGDPANGSFLDLEYMMAWVAFGQDGERQVERATFDPFPDEEWLAWLPEQALDDDTAQALVDELSFGGPEIVAGLEGTASMDSDSSVSPAGEHFVLHLNDPSSLSIWRRDLERNRRLTRGAVDTSWMPDSAGVIGVANQQADDATWNQLMLYASGFSREYQSFDYQQFDPVAIGADDNLQYALPLVSPNGAFVSFFVIDDVQRSVTLWMAGTDREPERVVTWNIPDDALLDVPLVAQWVGREALIFAEPVEWRDGMPGAVGINRVSMNQSGIIVEELNTIVGRGNDLGVVLEEMAIAPDEREIAYRLRHYRNRAINRERTDTLHVAKASDVSQVTQLVSGDPGYGQEWLDDGRWIVAGLDGRIAALSVATLDVAFLTESNIDARYPVVVSEAEIWYSGDDGSGGRVMRLVRE